MKWGFDYEFETGSKHPQVPFAEPFSLAKKPETHTHNILSSALIFIVLRANSLAALQKYQTQKSIRQGTKDNTIKRQQYNNLKSNSVPQLNSFSSSQ